MSSPPESSQTPKKDEIENYVLPESVGKELESHRCICSEKTTLTATGSQMIEAKRVFGNNFPNLECPLCMTNKIGSLIVDLNEYEEFRPSFSSQNSLRVSRAMEGLGLQPRINEGIANNVEKAIMNRNDDGFIIIPHHLVRTGVIKTSSNFLSPKARIKQFHNGGRPRVSILHGRAKSGKVIEKIIEISTVNDEIAIPGRQLVVSTNQGDVFVETDIHLLEEKNEFPTEIFLVREWEDCIEKLGKKLGQLALQIKSLESRIGYILFICFDEKKKNEAEFGMVELDATDMLQWLCREEQLVEAFVENIRREDEIYPNFNFLETVGDLE